MSEIDYLAETEDEFYGDFSGWEITDEELDALLIRARKDSDVLLRRLVKHTQYLRFLMPQLLDLAEKKEPENICVNLARRALRTIEKINQES